MLRSQPTPGGKVTTSLTEAQGLLTKARADLARQEIRTHWASILVRVLTEQEHNGALVPDFRGFSLSHNVLIGLAETYYGARLNEIETTDNVGAFRTMVTEAVGDQLAEFELAPQVFRSHQTGDIRLFFLRDGEHPTV